MSAKRYDLDAVVTVASGKMVAVDSGFGAVQEIVADLAGWPVMTHHMGDQTLMDAVAAKVIAQVSWLPGAVENMPAWPKEPDAAKAAIGRWLRSLRAAHGDTVTLEAGEPLPPLGLFAGLDRIGEDR